MSRPRQPITPEQRKVLDKAEELRESGMSWPRIAKALNTTPSWIRYRLDDTYNYLTDGPRRGRGHEIIPITDKELIVRRFVLDTRDFTAKVMGDPIPGDRRRDWEREAA